MNRKSFIFQFELLLNTLIRSTTTKYISFHCNIVVLIAKELESSSQFETSLVMVDSKLRNYAVICVTKKNSIVQLGNIGILWERETSTIFFLEIENNLEIIGSYFYLCFYCKELRIPVQRPSLFLKDDTFRNKWKLFSIFVLTVSPEVSTELSQNCRRRRFLKCP